MCWFRRSSVFTQSSNAVVSCWLALPGWIKRCSTWGGLTWGGTDPLGSSPGQTSTVSMLSTDYRRKKMWNKVWKANCAIAAAPKNRITFAEKKPKWFIVVAVEFVKGLCPFLTSTYIILIMHVHPYQQLEKCSYQTQCFEVLIVKCKTFLLKPLSRCRSCAQ